jgi:hypothetical protein
VVERHHDGKLEEKEGEQEEGFPGMKTNRMLETLG